MEQTIKKVPYSSPKLKIYGNLKTLTLFGGGRRHFRNRFKPHDEKPGADGSPPFTS